MVVSTAHVLFVNVGGVRTVDVERAPSRLRSGSRPWRVGWRGVNVSGDDQADREVHGGEHKAVYARPWARTRCGGSGNWAVTWSPGNFGENLTLSGVEAVVGERWRVGSALLEVSEPRFPASS